MHILSGADDFHRQYMNSLPEQPEEQNKRLYDMRKREKICDCSLCL